MTSSKNILVDNFSLPHFLEASTPGHLQQKSSYKNLQIYAYANHNFHIQ